MRKGWELTSEAFEDLLQWLSSDRNEAGIIYEKIRNGLMRFFIVRGCVNSESLADETINRVISKLPTIKPVFEGNPAHYFYNVAQKIQLEAVSSRRHREEQLEPSLHEKVFVREDDSSEVDVPSLNLLQKCLQEMSNDHRRLIVEYFTPDTDKAQYRMRLAEEAGMNLNTLRIKILRLKKRLEACISASGGMPA